MLHAAEPAWAPADREEFFALLGDLGLIDLDAGDADDAGNPWLGSQVLSLVMFLGCSPNVMTRPQDQGAQQFLLRFRYHHFPDIRCLSAKKMPTVRCPVCRAPAGVACEVDDPAGQYVCPQCGHVCAVHLLDWRQAAGFGCCFLEIAGIYPHEAVPSDRLLEALRGYSGYPWRCFYLD